MYTVRLGRGIARLSYKYRRSIIGLNLHGSLIRIVFGNVKTRTGLLYVLSFLNTRMKGDCAWLRLCLEIPGD
jgi:hypothetical protein